MAAIGSYEEFARALEHRPDGMSVLGWLANADRGGADWSLWLVRWLREHPHEDQMIERVATRYLFDAE